MKTRLIAIVIAVTFIVWCGMALGKWANSQAQESQNRMQSAMETLRR